MRVVMEVKYSIKTNSGVIKKKGTLGEFLESFNFLFRAKLFPPFSVVSDLCMNSPEEWGGTNRIIWEKFQIDEGQYTSLKPWASDKGYKLDKIPAEIDTAYKWSLWQFELLDGIPYDEHKRLTDKELMCLSELKKAEQSGDLELIKQSSLDYQMAAFERSSYFNSFY